MTQCSRLIALSLLTGSLLLHGCGSVKKTLGIDRPAPDEFAVTPSNQPLDMPPDFFTLPRPAPGTPHPQEEKERNAKKEKLLGAGANKGTVSPGQKKLLEMAGAETGQNKIRSEIDKESRIENAKKPILEKLGIKKKNTGTINPYDEAAELQKRGIPQNRQPSSE